MPSALTILLSLADTAICAVAKVGNAVSNTASDLGNAADDAGNAVANAVD